MRRSGVREKYFFYVIHSRAAAAGGLAALRRTRGATETMRGDGATERCECAWSGPDVRERSGQLDPVEWAGRKKKH